MSSDSPARWDASTYHTVSNPHVSWGARVLDRLELRGDEEVLDAGCGTGRLTALLAERLPRGRVIALDRDAGMLERAREHLAPFGDRVSFVQSALPALPLVQVDAIFSTATFHWVPDHPALFRSLCAALRPGGRLVAQCGGGANLARVIARIDAILAEPALAPAFAGFAAPWYYAGPDETRARLADAGFASIDASLELAPTPFASAEEYRQFLVSVVLVQRLAPLRDEALRQQVVERLVGAAASDEPPFVLDYVRLNLSARRPL